MYNKQLITVTVDRFFVVENVLIRDAIVYLLRFG